MVQRLRELREQMGISQEKLAVLTGLTARRIYSYERESTEPDIETLALLASFFGVTIDYLVGREESYCDKEKDSSLDLTKFGPHIEQYRNEKAMTRSELAEKVGITTAYLAVIESGAKIPRLETCIKILNALNASADAAFMDCLNGAAPKRANMIQSQISRLAPEKQRFILNILEAMVDAIDA